MVTLKEYEAYLRVKRIIDSCDEAEIISKLSNERNYIIESEGISPTKCYVSVNSNWVHPPGQPPGQPPGFAQKNCPGGRDLTFESCPVLNAI